MSDDNDEIAEEIARRSRVRSQVAPTLARENTGNPEGPLPDDGETSTANSAKPDDDGSTLDKLKRFWGRAAGTPAKGQARALRSGS